MNDHKNIHWNNIIFSFRIQFRNSNWFRFSKFFWFLKRSEHYWRLRGTGRNAKQQPKTFEFGGTEVSESVWPVEGIFHVSLLRKILKNSSGPNLWKIANITLFLMRRVFYFWCKEFYFCCYSVNINRTYF